MPKCKQCGRRVPQQHKDEFDMHKHICRVCWAINNSKYVDVKNKGGKSDEN